jgi:THO complex subunit 2
VQIYNATKAFLQQGQAFKVGKGENIWHQIHVSDLSNLYLLLGEAALDQGSPATWNEEGYYLAENGSFVWGDVLQSIAKIANDKGFLRDARAENLSPIDADRYMRNAKFSIGTNSRGLSIRGKKLLGWKPVQGDIMDELPTAVDSEARLLGLVQGHASKVAAGDI